MWESLEHVRWVTTLSTTGWMYATVSVTHYFTMFCFIGAIAMVDLRVLGLAMPGRPLEEVSDQLFPWAWTAFTLAMLSGFLMFSTAAGDWAPDWVFHVKLLIILAAMVFSIMVQRGAAKWSRLAEIPMAAKWVAAISLLLWVLAIISASEIPAREGLG